MASRRPLCPQLGFHRSNLQAIRSVSGKEVSDTEHLDTLGDEERDRIAGYAVRALMVVALFIGSCLLCTVPVGAMETTPFLVAFPIVGSIGYVVSVFFAYRLYKNMKKGK